MAFRKSDGSTVALPYSSASAESNSAAVNPPDTHIWGVYWTIVLFSIVELYSASSFEISKQGLYGPLLRHMMFLALGFVIILVAQRIHFKHFKRLGRWMWWGSAIAMIYVMNFGQVINGARRAINLGFMSLQPAEFIKISTVLYIAAILSETQLKKSEGLRNRGIVQAALVVIASGGLLFSQGLTNTALLMGISISMMLIGAIEWRKFMVVLCIYCIVGAMGMGVKMMMTKDNVDASPKLELYDPQGMKWVINAKDNSGDMAQSRIEDNTWRNRIKAWLGDGTPKYEQDITQKNLQEMRSYMAQAHGGWHGVFPGNSRETARLPLAFSDYIFAIIVEDWGFIGAIGLMVLYLWLLARAHFVAGHCTKAYPAFLVTGMAVMIALQALCHMAIVSGAGPVSGQPLPLFSKGGTSILVTSMAIGIMLSVSRYAVRTDAKAAVRHSEAENLPESIRAD
ncbi:MAG: FtsW/RodA/SpoVE family cell cycle protein, partial [Muribaculaceae bacterium]|nr:FtsW/RodA/SpoVE family cell cycle protein [Muribaculaceae bacterium]